MENRNDIKITNGIIHRDFIETTKSIEEKLKTTPYSALYNKAKKFANENAEAMGIPVLTVPFYKFIWENKTIPKPLEYIDAYFSFHKDLMNKDSQVLTFTFKGNKIDKRNLVYKLLRSYPSFVRDYHFYLKLLESNLFDCVSYSIENDLNGKDITVTYKDKIYEISLYAKTKRSVKEKQLKNTERNHVWTNEIELPLEWKNAQIVGDFKLYGDYFVEKVARYIVK